MGIHGLSKLLNDNAPRCVREHKMEYFAGCGPVFAGRPPAPRAPSAASFPRSFRRKIAIDASMQIYQFLIAVRQQGGEGQLTNEAGEVTSHLTGMLYRTIRMMEAGIKPVFVFDGKPPTLKSGELAKRKERQQAAETELTRLQEQGGSAEDVERQQKRTVRASREQSEEVKKLLGLMGVPVVDAPCEAEATCAALAKAGLVYATATEDMDALTFATPLLIRNLNSPEARERAAAARTPPHPHPPTPTPPRRRPPPHRPAAHPPAPPAHRPASCQSASSTSSWPSARRGSTCRSSSSPTCARRRTRRAPSSHHAPPPCPFCARAGAASAGAFSAAATTQTRSRGSGPSRRSAC